MGVSNGNKAAGTPIIQWPCANDADHFWQVQFQFSDAQNDYWFYIVNYNSGQCLAVPGGSFKETPSLCSGRARMPMTPVIQHPFGGYLDQYWHEA